jgi:hypothetical protein
LVEDAAMPSAFLSRKALIESMPIADRRQRFHQLCTGSQLLNLVVKADKHEPALINATASSKPCIQPGTRSLL